MHAPQRNFPVFQNYKKNYEIDYKTLIKRVFLECVGKEKQDLIWFCIECKKEEETFQQFQTFDVATIVMYSHQSAFIVQLQ